MSCVKLSKKNCPEKGKGYDDARGRTFRQWSGGDKKETRKRGWKKKE